jgi:hypothetical protein
MMQYFDFLEANDQQRHSKYFHTSKEMLWAWQRTIFWARMETYFVVIGLNIDSKGSKSYSIRTWLLRMYRWFDIRPNFCGVSDLHLPDLNVY